MPIIVPVYAAVLGIIFVLLSVRVAMMRRDLRVGVGFGNSPELERRIRVQGNFSEYVPISLILFTFVEWQGRPAWFIHVLCVALIVGRLLHAYGVGQAKEDIRFRLAGMITTFAVILIASSTLLMNAFTRAG